MHIVDLAYGLTVWPKQDNYCSSADTVLFCFTFLSVVHIPRLSPGSTFLLSLLTTLSHSPRRFGCRRQEASSQHVPYRPYRSRPKFRTAGKNAEQIDMTPFVRRLQPNLHVKERFRDVDALSHNLEIFTVPRGLGYTIGFTMPTSVLAHCTTLNKA